MRLRSGFRKPPARLPLLDQKAKWVLIGAHLYYGGCSLCGWILWEDKHFQVSLPEWQSIRFYNRGTKLAHLVLTGPFVQTSVLKGSTLGFGFLHLQPCFLRVFSALVEGHMRYTEADSWSSHSELVELNACFYSMSYEVVGKNARILVFCIISVSKRK